MAEMMELYQQAENSVLGVLIAEAEVNAAEVFSRVKPEDFVTGISRSIFETCREMYRQGDAIDPLTVKAACGTEYMAWLKELEQITPSSRYCSAYDLRIIGFDPWLSTTITQRLASLISGAGKSTQIVEIPQGMKSISPPMKEMEHLIRTHEMLHVHNTAARQCFANVRCDTDSNENIHPNKKRSRGRIDITVSWIIAFATSKLEPKPTLADAVASGAWKL